jgi:hypothetical protein
MTVNGEDVNSFIGRGTSLHRNGITVFCRGHSGYRESGGGVVMTGSTGCRVGSELGHGADGQTERIRDPSKFNQSKGKSGKRSS